MLYAEFKIIFYLKNASLLMKNSLQVSYFLRLRHLKVFYYSMVNTLPFSVPTTPGKKFITLGDHKVKHSSFAFEKNYHKYKRMSQYNEV